MYKTLLSLSLFLISFAVFAAHVDEITAKKVGENFLKRQTNYTQQNPFTLEFVYAEKPNNSTLSENELVYYYVFNVNSDGFILVSGDDNVSPILAYSKEVNFDPLNVPQNAKKWLEEYKNQIRDAIQNNVPASIEIKSNWENLLGQAQAIIQEKVSVAPLLLTKWNQSPHVNAQCPSNSVTGCVATAMAQVMKYWNYPETGTGFHSYNHQSYGTLSANFANTSYQWSSMPNTVSSANASVATLMYHVGVSVNMNYSPQGSGAYVISAASNGVNCAEYALKTHFGYKTTMQGLKRTNYTESQWVNLLKTDLLASHPIIYAGFGSGGGHAFVCDGFDDNDYFHFNWGWGGAYNGYFLINGLNPSGTGTGGGSGGYNSNHQAIIGMEPPAGTQTFDLALYNNVTPSPSTINYGQGFTVTTNIVNNGSASFNGDYTAAIFDASSNFIEYVETLSAYTLASGNAYTNNLSFTTSGMLSMLPGTYFVGILYRPTGGNWTQLANSGSYTNMTQIQVVNPSDIELNSAIVLTSGNNLTQGQTVTVNLNVINNGTADFIGQIDVDLYNLDGTYAQAIGSYTESNGLPAGYTYNSPFLNYTSSNITVAPGTYLMAVQHNNSGGGWQLTGSSNFQNPIKVTVNSSGIGPDIYEVNNSSAQAFNLPVSFSGNNATKNTVGSNLHINTDNDYYKVVFPAGFNYGVVPRLHDAFNSTNGNVYTVDALFSYSTDGITWSETYDDVLSGTIILNGGGTLFFRVAPYFEGEIGTYLLDMAITKSIFAIGIDEVENSDLIKVFPNPASESVSIDFQEYIGAVNQVEVFNLQGKLMKSLAVDENKKILFEVHDFSSGVYLIKLQTEAGILTKKIIVKR